MKFRLKKGLRIIEQLEIALGVRSGKYLIDGHYQLGMKDAEGYLDTCDSCLAYLGKKTKVHAVYGTNNRGFVPKFFVCSKCRRRMNEAKYLFHDKLFKHD